MRAFAVSLFALSLTIGSALAQDKASIEKLNGAFLAHLQKGDFAALGQMYTEDAVALPAGAPIVRGRSAIQAFWTKAAEGVADFKLTTIEVKRLGPGAAEEIGSFAMSTKGAQPQNLAGKYVVVWRKVGTEWKLATDIWNTDK
ncbi:DUF4440 domain-containing protein [Micromonospora sp. STR1s_5]|nr:DUF4440 domain-containing protein [Micromonospora sp. STR1s_5]